MTTPKAVIFDLDGTLFDKSGLPLYLILKQFLRGRLVTLKKERNARSRIKGKFFGSEEGFYNAFFNEFGNKTARKWYFDYYMHDMTHILEKHYHLNPWVLDTVKRLKQKGIKVVVFSDYNYVKEKLEALGLDLSLVDYYFDAPCLGGLKPCKESFLALCEAIGEQPSDCIMVGDRDDTDGAGARSVGMPFVMVKKNEVPQLDF